MTNHSNDTDSIDDQPTANDPVHDGSESQPLDRRGFLQRTAAAGLATVAGLGFGTAAASAASPQIRVEGEESGLHTYRIYAIDATFGFGADADPYPEVPEWADDEITLGQAQVEGRIGNTNVDNYTYSVSGSPDFIIYADGNLLFEFDPPIEVDDRVLVRGEESGFHNYRLRASAGDIELGGAAENKTPQFGDAIDDDDWGTESGPSEDVDTLDLVEGNIGNTGYDTYYVHGRGNGGSVSRLTVNGHLMVGL